jgi:hypothetical protein
MNRRILILASFGLLAGCATPVAPPPLLPPPPPAPLGELEPIYGASAGRDAVILQVASNGCTVKADFAFYVERKGEAVTLAFARKRLDRCRSFAMGKAQLAFTWAELGLAPRTPVFVLNPLTAWTGPS